MPTGIRYPSNLPPPLRDGYSTEYEDDKQSAEMEVGTPRRRRKYRIEPRLESLTFKFKQAQFFLFDTWFHNDIQGGAKLFDIPISDDLGGLTFYTARWVEGYESSIDSSSYHWTVTGKLRLLGEPFAIRAPGTDELQGQAFINVTATGRLTIDTPMRGQAAIEVAAMARLGSGRLFGSAAIDVTATGQLDGFYGVADPSATALATFDKSLLGLSEIDVTATGELA